MPRLAVVAAATAVVVSGGVLLGQAPAPQLSSATHYQQLLYTAHLRMFDLSVPAGAMTPDHAHDHDIVTVAIGETRLRTRRSGEDWGEPRRHAPGDVNVTSYTGAQAVHRVENVGTTPLRVFAVENLRDGGWSVPRLIAAPGTTLVQDARSFAVYDVRLTAAAPRTNHVHEMPTVVILVAGRVEVQGGGGESEFRMEAAGRWFPSQWDQPHTLTLLGGADARLVEVEAR